MIWKARNMAVLLLIMLGGLIVGFFLGELIADATAGIDGLASLGFLGYFRNFGVDNFAINLIVLRFGISFSLNFSIMGVICMLLFMFLYTRRR